MRHGVARILLTAEPTEDMRQVTMTSAVSMFGHKSEFDPFLYAPVGEERNGMLLGVLSALARLDVDPWQEAATLTKMPAQDATARLTSLLSSLPSDAATWWRPAQSFL